MILLSIQLCTIVILGFASAAPANISHGLPHLVPRDDPLGKFIFEDCDSTQEAVLRKAFLNIRDMLSSQRHALTTVGNYLTEKLNGESSELTTEIEIELETYKMFYGDFDYSDQCDIAGVDRAASAVKDVVEIDRILSSHAFSGSYSPTIFCSDKAFEYVRTEGNRAVYKNTRDPDQREVNVEDGQQAGICYKENQNEEGHQSAMMLYPPGNNADWMLICPVCFNRWKLPGSEPEKGSESDYGHISDWKSVPREVMSGDSLKDIFEKTVEGIVLHELSHTGAIPHSLDLSGQNSGKKLLPLDDVATKQGKVAYGLEEVMQLAIDFKDDPSKMVQNADTIAFHAETSYLNHCNWAPDGICK
ncbi:uncharacterized protein N7459_009604 [Penicillium hispanicum]|uniref:uncharacterized protein n=1 Tax=Penicillium hispanicum TaxID=1080232 RepID=UPI002540FD64|nr:uncharacterized protein N7459_009604 [Penicillium hispanicum]KAJ5570174.1 hypothetical protein N7459_009604 [Penicillium hispanicum]